MTQSCLFFLMILFILFLDRGEGRVKDRERNINVWLPLLHPLLGTWPEIQACALTGNQTIDLWVLGQCSIHWATLVRAQSCFYIALKCPFWLSLCLPTTETRDYTEMWEVWSFHILLVHLFLLFLKWMYFKKNYKLKCPLKIDSSHAF